MLAFGRDWPHRGKALGILVKPSQFQIPTWAATAVRCAHEPHCGQLSGILCCSLMIDFFREEAEDRAKFRPKGKRR